MTTGSGTALAGLALLGGLLVAGVVRIGRLPQILAAHPQEYVPVFLGCFVLYTLAVVLVQRGGVRGRGAHGVILVVALLLRWAAWVQPPSLSTDVYRYLWDGHISATGINPYRYPPSAPELREHRTSYWPLLNHKHMATMYPPVSQLFFLSVNRLAGESVWAYKAAMVLADLATLVLILLLLRGAGLPMAWSVIYAWHPLVVMEVAGSGHQDAVGIALMAGALLACAAGGRAWQSGLAGALAGLSLMAKGYVLPAMPVLARRRPIPFVLAAGAAVLPLAALYWGGGVLLVGLGQYLRYRPRNPCFHPYLVAALSQMTQHPEDAARFVSGAILAGVMALLAWRPASNVQELAGRLVAAIGTLLLLAPIVYPWYALWLVPGLCLQWRAGWFLLTGLIPLAYLNPVPSANPWVPTVEYAPVLLLLVWEWLARRRPPNSPVDTAPAQ